MYFDFSHARGGYCRRLYDDRNRLLSKQQFPDIGLRPEGVALEIRLLMEAFEGKHNIQFHYETLKAAKEVGMVLGGPEEVRRAVSQTKDQIAKREQQRKRKNAEWRAKRVKVFVKRVVIVFWIIVFVVVIRTYLKIA